MRLIGFSTGALALGDFRQALQIIRRLQLPAVELSALRERELPPLLNALDELDLNEFRYVSLHAPSSFDLLGERQIVELLMPVAGRGIPVIVHPDVIRDYELWIGFKGFLCIENMDRRKPTGRTARELASVFECVPLASLCFDIGHARQVDPTMSHAVDILTAFGSRLRQVHLSDVNTRSMHEPINGAAAHAFWRVSHLIPEHVPIILETPVAESDVQSEVEEAHLALASI